MSKQYTLVLRPAIAMIELIFAIVIIGITLLSAPLVLNQSIQSSTVAMQQESIAAAATQISLILTHNWDANASTPATGYGILSVSAAGNPDLNATNRDLNATFSTRLFNPTGSRNATPFVSLGQELNDFNNNNDLDDFTNTSRSLTIYGAENESLLDNKGEYLDTRIIMTDTISYALDVVTSYTANTYVRYNNPFRTTNASTNIKLINVRLTTDSAEGEHAKTVVLGAFSCNIGVPNPAYVPLQP